MARNHTIKLNVKTERELKKLTPCTTCKKKVEYGKLYLYLDESNIAITNNSRAICKQCKDDLQKNKWTKHN